MKLFKNLRCSLISYGNAGFLIDYIHCLDQCYFLWKDSNGNLLDIGRKQIQAERWRRSLYKWLHSSLINSLEKEIESYDSKTLVSASLTNSTSKSPHYQRDYTEKFEEEFFLWQDVEGNPLRFGLKQVNESSKVPFSERITTQNESKFNKIKTRQSSPMWQNPLLYEDNNDDDSSSIVDENSNIRDIIKSKFGAIFNFLYPQKISSNFENDISLSQRSEVHLNKTHRSNYGSYSLATVPAADFLFKSQQSHFVIPYLNNASSNIVSDQPVVIYDNRKIQHDVNQIRKTKQTINSPVSHSQQQIDRMQSKYNSLDFIENSLNDFDNQDLNGFVIKMNYGRHK